MKTILIILAVLAVLYFLTRTKQVPSAAKTTPVYGADNPAIAGIIQTPYASGYQPNSHVNWGLLA